MKTAIASKTLWGIVMMVLPTLLTALGVTQAEAGSVMAYIQHTVEVIGTLMAIYGRWTAAGPLKLL